MLHYLKINRIAVCSLLILLFAGLNYAIMKVNGQSALVYVDPASETVSAIGETFTVNVSVANVSDLYGYEFKLYYNPTVMNGTPPVAEDPFLKSGGQTFFSVTSFTDNYNSTIGIVWIECALTGQVPGVNGNGVLATITFKSITQANAVSISLADVKLVDANVNSIPYQVSDGTVTIIPEFTPIFASSTLIILSLLIILVLKRSQHKTHFPN